MIHGLTFVASSYTTDSLHRWNDQLQQSDASLDRYRRVVLAGQDHLSPAERQTLASIDQQGAQPAAAESDRKCLECGRPFAKLVIRGAEIDYCRYCRGIWFDPGELKSLTGLAKDVPARHKAHRRSRYKCPVCGDQMAEMAFASPLT